MFKKSTLARINLIAYGLNCAGLCISVVIKFYGFMVWNAIFIAYFTMWFSKHYFDIEEKNNDSNSK